VTPDRIAQLNRAFGTNVTLHNCFLHEAGFPEDYFDRIFSISTIEHIPAAELGPLMREISRILRPGGRFVATIDLFLNVRPFTERESNRYGSNADVRALAEAGGMRLVQGKRAELHGYPEFDSNAVLTQLNHFLVGTQYPALAQCVVFDKPAAP
jgi:SAM-dependent methyltransferase